MFNPQAAFFVRSVARFEAGGARFRAEERYRGLGLLLLAGFGLLLAYFSGQGDYRLAALAVGLPLSALGVWLLGYHRRSLFDRPSDRFEHVAGWFFARRVTAGRLDAIEHVRLQVFQHTGGGGGTLAGSASYKISTTARLHVLCRGRSLLVSQGGAAANLATAKRLAALIGCALVEPSARQMVSQVEWRARHRGTAYTVSSYDGAHTTVSLDGEEELPRGFQARASGGFPLDDTDLRARELRTLLAMGASLVDIGFSSNGCFVEFPAATVNVDGETARRTAEYLCSLRDRSR